MRGIYDLPMSGTAGQTDRIARLGARRALVADILKLGGRGLMWGASISAAAVGLSRIAGDKELWPWLVAGPPIVGLACGLGIAWARRWPQMHAARQLDLRLGLKDRLSTAMALRGQAGPFSQWSVQEAEAAAAGVQLGRAVPLRAEWTWGAWPMLVAAALLGGVYLPSVNWSRPRSSPAVMVAEKRDAANQVAKITEALRQTVAQNEAKPDQLRELEKLEQELASGTIDAQKAREQAASKLNDLARTTEDKAKVDQASAEMMRDELAKAAAQKPPVSKDKAPLASAIDDALKRGDLAAAGEAAKQAADQFDRMSESERKELARELDDLAQAIEDAKREVAAAEAAAKERQQAAAQKPPENGQSPKPREDENGKPPADKPPDAPKPPEPESAKPSDPVTAEKQEQKSQQDRAKEEGQKKADEVARSARDAARELRGEKPPGGQRPRDNQNQQGSTGATGERQGPTGASGASGSTGQQGSSGVSGNSGSSGSSGGSRAPSGATGSSGRSGATGAQSSTGASGGTGASGASGTSGSSGATGAEGPSGASGQSGATGPGQKPQAQPGATGQSPQPGATGAKPEGPSGPSGQGEKPQGQPGATGQGEKPQGPTGSTGTSQQPGATGTGEKPQGQPGSTGTTPRLTPGAGPSGQTGPSGLGATGASGQSGSTGARPDTGAVPGASGATGQQGASGTTGASGAGGPTGADQQPGEGPPRSDAPENGKAPSLEKFAQKLRDAAQQAQKSQQSQEQARKMEEMARQMLEKATPEQRQKFEQLAGDLAKKQPPGRGIQPGTASKPNTPGTPATPRDANTKPVDARPTKPGDEKKQERVIAEWYSDKPIDRNGVSEAPAGEEMQRAADAADRAVEQQTVPAKYSGLIKRVFKRYAEQVPVPKETPKN